MRKRIDGGFTDAVGYLRSRTDTDCVVETRHGMVTIALAEVTAAKVVPPPPPRRAPRIRWPGRTAASKRAQYARSENTLSSPPPEGSGGC